MSKVITFLFTCLLIGLFQKNNVGIPNSKINNDYIKNNYTEVIIGNSGNYENLTGSTGLFNAINSGALTGTIVAKIKESITETGEKTLSRRTNDYNLTIVPIDENIRIISGGSTNGLIVFEGADNVTIDGRYNGNGRFLIFRNIYNNSGTTSPTIKLYSGASNNMIINCVIEGNHPSGVLKIDEGGTYGNNNNIFSNNIIRNRSDGNYGAPDNLFYSIGKSIEVPNDNNTFSHNELLNFNVNAIYCTNTGNKNWTISNNYIHEDIEPSSTIACIYFGSKGTNLITENIMGNISTIREVNAIVISDAENTKISKNKIFNIKGSTSSTNKKITGINILGYNLSSNIKLDICNNFISLVPLYNNNQSIYGIRDRGYPGNIINVFNNTVLIGGTLLLLNDSNSWAYFRQNGCPTTSTIKNNIFFNNRTGGSGNHFAIGDESARTENNFTVSNNLYLGTGSTAVNFLDRTNSSTPTPRNFEYWVTNANDPFSYGVTASSITATEFFNNPTTGDLSIKNSNPICWAVNGKGVSLSDISEDYFGNSRTTLEGVPIDIGAHEFNTTTNPFSISINPVSGINNFNYLGRNIASINFAQQGTLPSSIAMQYFSGVEPPNSNSNCIKSYWIITPTGGSGYNYSLTLNTVPSEHNQILANTLKIAKSNDNGNNWSIIPATVIENTLTITNQNSFSHFTATNNDTPFPVKLLFFKIFTNQNNANLFWQTSEEINNSGFEIERKSGNENWEKIGFVKGNNKPSEYNFEDRNLKTGKYSYRLKQIDYNGNYEYFELKDLIDITPPGNFGLSQNYPNPFNSKTVINWQIPKPAFVSIKIYDIKGSEVNTIINGYKEAGYHSTIFDASGLSSGVYYYRMISGNYSKTEKLLLIK